MGALPTRVGYADQSSIAGWVTGTELFTTSAPKRAETINVAVAQSVQNANDGEIARSPVNNTPKNNPIQKTHANMGNARVGTLPQKW